jgi:alkylation response protein AidB-like acyl-CoA dehydrogenase
MPLVLTEDEVMLVDAARGFLAKSAPVSALRALRDSGDALRYTPQLWSEMAENGFIAPHVPEAEGGLGMGYAAAGLIAEQMGHTLAPTPFLSAAIAAELVVQAGSAAQKAELLPQIIGGELVVAFAFEEGARHKVTGTAVKAAAKGDGWTVDGTKRIVLDAVGAKLLIVAAATDAGPALFLVDPEAAGVTVRALDLIDSRNAADIDFAGVPATLLGEAGGAKAAIARALDVARALLGAELLGVADECFDRTVAYLKERVQFGRPIGSFQALQHRAARLYARLDLTRGAVLKALRALDEGDPSATLLCSLSKGAMTKLARDVMVEAVHMHGGIGVTDDLDIGLFFKRARVAGDLFGDDHFHTDRIATQAFGI